MTNQFVDQKVRQFTGRHMLIILVSFFGVILLMNIVFAWLALGSWPGLLARNGFRASQSYNQQISEAQVQSDLNWRSEIVLVDGSLGLTITDSDGTPVTGLDVKATVGRPTHEGADRDYLLTETGRAYASPAALTDGIWTISVQGAREGNIIYRQDFRISIRNGSG